MSRRLLETDFKKCNCCNQSKPISEFSKRILSGYRSECKFCRKNKIEAYKREHPEKRKICNRNYYKTHSESIKARVNAWEQLHPEETRQRHQRLYKKHREEWIEALAEIGFTECLRCGYDKCFAAIDFHHPDPSQKDRESAKIISLKFTPERLEEIKKLKPLCANCHREFHVGIWV